MDATNKNTKKRLILIYSGALILSAITWNFIISNFIFNQSAVLFDNEIGNRRYPKTRSLNTREGYGNFFTDDLGFNNKSISEQKSNKKRILVLGDSITEAVQLDISKSFSSLTEKYLNRSSNNYEVFNLGFSGRSVPDYINYSEGYIRKFSPDFVIIQINYNDFTGDAIKTSKHNYISLENEEIKIINNPHAKNELVMLSEAYKKARWLQPIIAHTANNFPLSELKNIFKKKTIQASGDDFSFGQSKKTLTDQHKKIIEWQLRELVMKYKNNFALLYTGVVPLINNGEMIEKEDDDVLATKNEIKKACDNFNIPFIDPTDEFLEFYHRSNQLPRGFDNSMPGSGHLNENGHKIIAEIIYNFIKSKNL
jgi:lysophospholipase L1-like esterase